MHACKHGCVELFMFVWCGTVLTITVYTTLYWLKVWLGFAKGGGQYFVFVTIKIFIMILCKTVFTITNTTCHACIP